jgi:hypothetical protein
MTQITWRNVNAPSLADASRPLDSAQRSFDSMFGKLADVIGRSQAVEDKNWETGKTNRTNDALNRINSFLTPEEFSEAQKTGAIQALLNQGQIDQQAVRAAADSRLGVLQQRAKTAIDYRNTMIDDQTSPIADRYRLAAINGDQAGMAAAMSEYAAKQGRNGAALAEFGDNRQYLGVTRDRDATRFQWDGQDQAMQMRTGEDNLLTNAVQRQQMQNAMRNANASRSLAEREFAFRQKMSQAASNGGSAAMEKQFQAFKENSSHSMGVYGTKEGNANLMKGLSELGVNPDQRDDILTVLAERYKSGVPVTYDDKGKPQGRLPIPVSVILEEAARSSDNPLASMVPGWSRKGDVMANNIDKRFGVQSNGSKDASVFDKRDQDLVDEMMFMNKINTERTQGLFNPNQSKEIVNPSKKSSSKSTSIKNPLR